ncbi:DUF1772 domain-containing protein [Leucobacter sp. CSA2]|uniref:DUF1772 domain-containing protein n=1 Tax=Leucobacter edaphi TaxID=2796472 RepID=A0A934QEX3_9MICO|nr:anthrone oxygenase family protein [Leucobacter edaphi]MBK0422142.1 DUF1772 domain-containing protein [Leucobacter edaphi]
MPWLDKLAVLSVALNGVLAGLYFAFTCAVSPALGRLEDRSFVVAFRAINAAILNGWFLSVFFLAPLTAVAAAIWGGSTERSFPWALVAGGVLAAVTFIVTVAANVPLNEGLAAAPSGSAALDHAARAAFESAWNGWNLLRTLTGTAATVCLAAALAVGR